MIGSLTALLAFASNAHAAQAFKQSPPETYLVQNGDTLWDIAEKFLESPWLWPEVWHINSQIENPHYIYQGDTIKLVYIDGKPRLTVDRGTGSDSHKQYLPDGTLKLTPRKRVSHLTTEIPSVPLDAIQSFLVNHRVVDKSTLDNAPYVVAGSENLGYEAIQIGLGKFLEQTDDIARVKLVESDEEVRISDLLIPTLEQRVQSVFHPKSPKQEIDGKIIHVFAGVRNVSQYDVVVINKGEREEMEVGDVLATYRVGERVRDRKTNELLQLPSERSGLMIIFRTFEKVSFGLIMKSYKSITVMDEVKNP